MHKHKKEDLGYLAALQQISPSLPENSDSRIMLLVWKIDSDSSSSPQPFTERKFKTQRSKIKLDEDIFNNKNFNCSN